MFVAICSRIPKKRHVYQEANTWEVCLTYITGIIMTQKRIQKSIVRLRELLSKQTCIDLHTATTRFFYIS